MRAAGRHRGTPTVLSDLRAGTHALAHLLLPGNSARERDTCARVDRAEGGPGACMQDVFGKPETNGLLAGPW